MIDYDDPSEGRDLVIYDNHWDNVEAWIRRNSNDNPRTRRKRYNPNRKTKQQVIDAKRQRGNFKLRMFD
jgi:hypothetical protein